MNTDRIERNKQRDIEVIHTVCKCVQKVITCVCVCVKAWMYVKEKVSVYINTARDQIVIIMFVCVGQHQSA